MQKLRCRCDGMDGVKRAWVFFVFEIISCHDDHVLGLLNTWQLHAV
jgi:hypothetical protein